MVMPSAKSWAALVIGGAITYGIAQLAKFSGPEVCFGFLIGFLSCYGMYRCWRVDDANENYQRFPENERTARYARDWINDPRLRD